MLSATIHAGKNYHERDVGVAHGQLCLQQLGAQFWNARFELLFSEGSFNKGAIEELRHQSSLPVSTGGASWRSQRFKTVDSFPRKILPAACVS